MANEIIVIKEISTVIIMSDVHAVNNRIELSLRKGASGVTLDFLGVLAIQTDAARGIVEQLKKTFGDSYGKKVKVQNISRQVNNAFTYLMPTKKEEEDM